MEIIKYIIKIVLTLGSILGIFAFFMVLSSLSILAKLKKVESKITLYLFRMGDD